MNRPPCGVTRSLANTSRRPSGERSLTISRREPVAHPPKFVSRLATVTAIPTERRLRHLVGHVSVAEAGGGGDRHTGDRDSDHPRVAGATIGHGWLIGCAYADADADAAVATACAPVAAVP